MSPKEVRPFPNPRDLWVDYFIWQKGIKAADAIKVTSQLTLK